jgi:hypothetical protein
MTERQKASPMNRNVPTSFPGIMDSDPKCGIVLNDPNGSLAKEIAGGLKEGRNIFASASYVRCPNGTLSLREPEMSYIDMAILGLTPMA